MGYDKEKWDQRRRLLEGGSGGDHDEPFRYQDPTKDMDRRRLHAFINTMWLTLHGLMGGKDDGEDEVG